MRGIFVCLILLSSFLTRAQAVLDSLYKWGLISNIEKNHAAKVLSGKGDWKIAPKPPADADALNMLFYVKMYSTPGTYHLFGFRPGPVEIPASKEKQVIADLSLFADKLLKTNLISTSTYEDLISQVKSLELRQEFDMLSAAQLASNRQFYFKPEYFNSFADSLLVKNMISRQAYDTLIAQSAAGTLHRRMDYLKYLKGAVFINPKDKSSFLERVYKQTASALPGLSFDKFSYQVELDSSWSNDTIKMYDIKVSIEKDGRTFRHKSYFDPKNLHLDEQEYYQIFNKMLADQQSPYRLHMFRAENGVFGIIPLTKQQAQNFGWRYDDMMESYLDLSYERFVNKLTQANIRTAINIYDSLGLLSHLTKKEIDSCVEAMSSKTLLYYSDILSGFKNLVFEIDLEYGVDDGQYKLLTKQLAGISKGHFNPTSIIDEYNYERNKQFRYGFTLNNKKYITRLEQTDDWLDAAFYDLIDQAVKEQDAAGVFYYLYPNDGMRIVYLTHAQYAALKQLKLIELETSDAEQP